MPIADDWTIDYNLKRVYHSAGTTVYTVNELYSWLMDIFDAQGAMDDEVPMSAQTPTEYTFINEWFIDDESTKYLKEGAIKTSGYDGKIQVLELLESGYTNCVADDIGKQVKDDTVEIGPLLAYNNTTRKWWIRSISTVADASAMTITSGTGAGTGDGASVTGEDLYSNIYTLGAIISGTWIYVTQAGSKKWYGGDRWWSSGHVDVLLKVKEAGTEIEEAKVTVYARMWTDYFDHYEIDLTAGGRNAVPMATSDDLDNATAESMEGAIADDGGVLTDETTAANSEATNDMTLLPLIPVVGDAYDFGGKVKFPKLGLNIGISGDGVWVITWKYWNGSSWADLTHVEDGTDSFKAATGWKYVTFEIPSDWETKTIETHTAYYIRAEVTAYTSKVTIPKGTQSKVLGTVANYIKGIKFHMVNGTLDYDGGSGDAPTVGKVAHDGVSHATGYQLEVGAVASGTLTLGDVEGTFGDNNALEELDELKFDAKSGQFTVGLTVTGGTSGATGIIRRVEQMPNGTVGKLFLSDITLTFQDNELLTDTATGKAYADGTLATTTWAALVNLAITITHTMNKDLNDGAGDKPYDVIIDLNGDSVADLYELLKYLCREGSEYQLYRIVAATITPIDGEQYQIAYTGYPAKKTSPLGTFAGGKYFGARGVWIEDMQSSDIQSYSLIDSNGDARTPPNWQTIKVSALGQVLTVWDRVVVFRTTGNNNIIDKEMYSMTAQGTGLGTITVQEAIETDTPETGVVRVRDVSAGAEQIYNYTSWSGSVFTIEGTTSQAYGTDDKVYVPFIDRQADATDEDVSVIYAEDRWIVTRVRNKGIIPFEITGKFISTGYAVAAIRTEDAIVT